MATTVSKTNTCCIINEQFRRLCAYKRLQISIVKKDQPILRLSNTDIELSLVNQQTSVYNLLTQMQIARNAAQQNTTTKLNQMTDVESQLKEAERIYRLDKDLYEQKAIGSQEFKKAEND